MIDNPEKDYSGDVEKDMRDIKRRAQCHEEERV
jgi:hypothetical protein